MLLDEIKKMVTIISCFSFCAIFLYFSSIFSSLLLIKFLFFNLFFIKNNLINFYVSPFFIFYKIVSLNIFFVYTFYISFFSYTGWSLKPILESMVQWGNNYREMQK